MPLWLPAESAASLSLGAQLPQLLLLLLLRAPLSVAFAGPLGMSPTPLGSGPGCPLGPR